MPLLLSKPEEEEEARGGVGGVVELLDWWCPVQWWGSTRQPGWASFLWVSSPAFRAPACSVWRAEGSPSGLNWRASFLQGCYGRRGSFSFPRKVIKVQCPEGLYYASPAFRVSREYLEKKDGSCDSPLLNWLMELQSPERYKLEFPPAELLFTPCRPKAHHDTVLDLPAVPTVSSLCPQA